MTRQAHPARAEGVILGHAAGRIAEPAIPEGGCSWIDGDGSAL